MNEPYETLDNAIELEQLDHREQAYEAEVHNLVSQLRQLIEHQPPETGVHHFFSAIATLQLVANNGGIASLTDEEARAITNELEQLDHREQADEAEVHNLVSQLRQAAQWLQNLRNAGYTDILIDHQPPKTGVHHFFSAIAHAERTSIEEVVLSFDMRHAEAHLRSSQVEPAVGDEATEAGWTRYRICQADFDRFGKQVEYHEYIVYDYELGQEELIALDDILSKATDDTPPDRFSPFLPFD